MLGARRGQVIGQFLSESVVFSLIAFGVSISLFELFLPVFNALFETTLSTGTLIREWMLSAGAGIAFVVGVIAGSYSAFFLSSFSPIQAIRGTLQPGTLNAGLRQALVVVQFAISTLIVCDPCRYCIDAFFLYLKVCAEVLHKGEKVREGDLQVAVEVKGRVESDFACFFAKS